MAHKIKVYSISTCQHCRMLKKYLKKEGIDFENIDVEENHKAAHEMIEKSGQMGVPVLDINGEIVIGFDRDKIEAIIKHKKIKQHKEEKVRAIVYDVIIIGAGPAGITAAIYLARRKLNVLMLYKELGGKVAYTSKIKEYHGFRMLNLEDFIKRLEEHTKKYSIAHKNEIVEKIEKKASLFEIKTQKNMYKGKALIIATGTKEKNLKVKGESKFVGRGVAYCATCDAPLFKNKDVAVVGGGNTALETVIQLEKYARKIYVITIYKELKGEHILRDKVKSFKKVEIINNVNVKEIKGDKFVSSIIIEREGKEKELKVQGVFIGIGHGADSELVDVKKNEDREIIINSNNETSVPGIFAAGDVTNVHAKQIIVAAGEGAKAALSAAEYLDKLK